MKSLRKVAGPVPKRGEVFKASKAMTQPADCGRNRGLLAGLSINRRKPTAAEDKRERKRQNPRARVLAELAFSLRMSKMSKRVVVRWIVNVERAFPVGVQRTDLRKGMGISWPVRFELQRRERRERVKDEARKP